MSQNCGNCHFGSNFLFTPTGRFKKAHAGRCTAPMPELQVPECVVVTVYKNAIWPDMGEKCTFWKGRTQ